MINKNKTYKIYREFKKSITEVGDILRVDLFNDCNISLIEELKSFKFIDSEKGYKTSDKEVRYIKIVGEI